METSDPSPLAAPGARVPTRRRRLLPIAVLGLVVVLVVLTGWLAVRAYQAATSLQAVADGVVQIRGDVRAARTDDLAAVARQVERDAARAARATGDPVWWVAERLPVVGVDAVAVRVAAQAADDLATEVLGPLVRLASELDIGALGIVDGRVDTAPLVAARPDLDRAARATARVRADLDAVDPDRLHGPLGGAIDRFQTGLADADAALDSAARLAAVLPPMLGAEGRRDYLLMFLNSAELRAQGGIVGSLAVITAEDGRLSLTDQASTLDMPRWEEPVLPLTDAELAVATDIVGRRVQNAVVLPDTPRAGELVAEMWRRARGQTVDGVVAVDPVALSYLLGATGDVRHPDGTTLSADTLVQTLLFSVYQRLPDPTESDDFFAAAAAAAFEQLVAGAGDPGRMLEAFGRATAERRLSVWSTHPAEQELIAGTPVDGALLSGGHDDAVGIFLDNTSGWKTDTFLRTAVHLEAARCERGTVTMQLRLDLTSTLPADAGTLPYYVVGDGSTGVPVGGMRMRVSVYTPVGGRVEEVRRGDAFVGAHGATMQGRDVRVMTEELGPGESASYLFTVTAPVRGDVVPVWTTPTTSSPGLSRQPLGCGG